MLPDTFVRNAATGDFICGVLAPIVLMVAPSRNTYMMYHVFSMLELAFAMGTGAIVTAIRPDPRMDDITTFPVILIPLVLVPFVSMSHIIAIDQFMHDQHIETESVIGDVKKVEEE